MKITLGRILLVLFAVAVGGLLVYALMPAPVEVDMGRVVRGRLQVTVDEDGRTRIKERYVVSAPLAGKIERITLDPGDPVEAGKTLLTTIAPTDPALLDDRALAQARARVKAAEATYAKTEPAVESAKAEMEYAESQLARFRKLDQREAVSDQEVEQAELQYRTAVEKYRSARFASDIARYELEVARAALLRSLPRELQQPRPRGNRPTSPSESDDLPDDNLPNNDLPSDDPLDDDLSSDDPSSSVPSGDDPADSVRQPAARSTVQINGSIHTNDASSGSQLLVRDLELRAPITGRVLRVFEENATVVSAGTPLIELGNLRDLEIEVDVLSADAVKIKPGAKVLLEQWGGAEPLEGKVRRVEPAGFTKISALGVEEQRVWVIADFTAPPERWSALGDGYRVEARIVIWEDDDVVKVPTSALFRHGDRWAVFCVENGRARLRLVEIGRRNGLEAQVLRGLEPNAQVIVHPSDKVVDGVKVRLRPTG